MNSNETPIFECVSFKSEKMGSIVKIIIAQPKIEKKNDKELPEYEKFVRAILKQGIDSHLIIFPEYSIPQSFYDFIKEWSKKYPGIIVAGTDVYQEGSLQYNRAAIFYRGEQYYTEKLYPSPHETDIEIVARNNYQNVFVDTPVGTLGILICHDINSPTRILDKLHDHSPDIICVIACQNDAVAHHNILIPQLNQYVNEHDKGLYIAYCNLLCLYDNTADGHSAFFSVDHASHYEQGIKDGFISNRAATVQKKSNCMLEMIPEAGYLYIEAKNENRLPYSQDIRPERNVIKKRSINKYQQNGEFKEYRWNVKSYEQKTEYPWEYILKKVVEFVCLEYQKGLYQYSHISGKDILSPDAQDEIFRELVDLFSQSKYKDKFTYESILPNQAAFSDGQRKRLHYKLVQLIEFYNISQLYNDSLNDKKESQELFQQMKSIIDSQLERINNIHVIDTATYYHTPPKKRNDFHFCAETVDFIGREKQLEQLSIFCNEPDNLLVWGVVGKGGSGKSRLSHELLIRQLGDGWSVCMPPDHRRETLNQCSDRLPYKTLFILDYSEYNIDDIKSWINSLRINKHANDTIRILLIFRSGQCAVKFYGIDHLFKNKQKYQEDQTKFLELIPILPDDLQKIIRNYAEKKSIYIESEEAKRIYEQLECIDRNFTRPLFALIMADAFIIEKRISLSREDALQYIYEKEIKYIESIIKEEFSEAKNSKDLVEITKDLIVMSTMTGGLNLDTELQLLLPEEYADLKVLSNASQRRYNNLDLFVKNGSEFIVPPLEPDIIGEDFVLRRFEENHRAEKMIPYAMSKPYYMQRFIHRLQDDFPHRLNTINGYFSTVYFPPGIVTIAKCSFQEIKTLKNIFIPNSVEQIGDYAFQYCTSLDNLRIEEGVKTIGEGAFKDCYSITELVIPNSVTYIGVDAFGFCEQLRYVSLPDSVTEIGDGAFFACKSLHTIKVPESVINIGIAAIPCTTTILTKSGSFAEEYAKTNKISYIIV